MPHPSSPPVPGTPGAAQDGQKKLPDTIAGKQQQRQPGRTIVQTAACPPAMRRTNSPWCFSDFGVVRLLGEGQMSSVVHCVCIQSGMPVAVKMYHKDRMNSLNVKQVAREIDIHASLQHQGIIQLYAAFEDKDGIYLVEELATKGDLFGELSRKGGYMQEGYVVKNVLLPFLSALGYLHGQGVLHRDIKPENIMLGEAGQVLIGDFGLAINIVKERPVSRVGTLDYMPPEVVRLPLPSQQLPQRADLERPPSYGLAVDVWCVGILAYELLIGGPPFETDSRDETYTRIVKMQPHLPSHLSDHAKDFLSQCLRKEPSQRPTIMQLLRHPWIKTYQPGAQKRSVEGRLSQLLSPQPSPPESPKTLTKSPAPESKGEPLSVQPSAASAPCLAPAGRVLFSPFAGRFAPKAKKPLAAGGPADPLPGVAADRNSRFNSFASTQSLMSSPGASPNGKALKQAAAGGGSGNALGRAPSEGASGPHGGWVETDTREQERAGAAELEGAAPAIPSSGMGSSSPALGDSKAKHGAEGATNKFQIRVDAGPLPGGSPAPGTLFDVESISQQAGLIPASRSQTMPAPVGLPMVLPVSTNSGLVDDQDGMLATGKNHLAVQGRQSSPGGTPGASCLSGLKSRLSGLGKALLPGSAGGASRAFEGWDGKAGIPDSAQGPPPKIVSPITAPAIAEMLAPGPGAKPARKSFLSALGSKLGRRSSSSSVTPRGDSTVLVPSGLCMAPQRGASTE